jgi:hypothetical protein
MGLIVAVDSQKLNAIQNCMRKFNFTFGEFNMEPTVRPDFFEKGDLVHKMLQMYYTLRQHRHRWQPNGRTHADIVDSCVKWGRFSALRMQLDFEEVEMVIKTFRDYCTYVANDGWDRIIFVEKVGSKVLYESSDLTILYETKIDLGIGLTNVPVIPVDHKTGSRRQSPEELSNQFMGYCWALGVNNIIVNKIGFQKTLKPEEKFQRHTLSYSNDQLEEWVSNSVWWIKFALGCVQEKFYPANYTSCDKYSGCVYREVCKASKSIREFKLHSLFEERAGVWDVGKDLE